MTTAVRSCMQLLLKLVNSLIGMCGIATICYAVWMIKIWHLQVHDSYPLAPWFMYAIFGFGAILCAITCCGHIAAEMANIYSLYCYLIFLFSILILEGAVAMDVIMNPNWEKDFPQDPSGNLVELRDFIKENTHFCKWVGFSVISVEGLSMFLAVILIAIGPNQRGYDSDNEYTVEGVPLLKNYSKHVNMRPLQSSIIWQL